MHATLRKGDVGPEVGALQQALLESGRTVDAEELDASRFGDSTADAVAGFQAHSAGPNGPLAVDCVVGPATWFALEHPAGGWAAPGWVFTPDVDAPAGVLDVCRAAVADLGLHEEPNGSNDGPQLTKFRPMGRPWCALAVSTWWQVYPAGSPWGVVAGTATLSDWARKMRREVPLGARVRSGDVFVIQRGDGHGHAGLIVGVDGYKLFTVEGNSGNAVRGCVRWRGDLTIVFRPVGEV